MAERDAAGEVAKNSNDPDIIREYKTLKNAVNRLISKEKLKRKTKNFSDEETTIKEKWQKAKN